MQRGAGFMLRWLLYHRRNWRHEEGRHAVQIGTTPVCSERML
jgi:hypothetical protein